MRKFDYSFLENQVPAKLLNLTALIYDIKGKESVRLNSNPKLFNKLIEVFTKVWVGNLESRML